MKQKTVAFEVIFTFINVLVSIDQPENAAMSSLLPSGKLTELYWKIIIVLLVGGLEHFLFLHILGIIIPIDFHIFQRGSKHQPV